MYLPIRTLRTSGIPRCRIAAPCGSSTAALGMTTTLTFIASPYWQLTARTSAIPEFTLPLAAKKSQIAIIALLVDLELHRLRQRFIDIKIHAIIAGRPASVRPRERECPKRIRTISNGRSIVHFVIRRSDLAHVLGNPDGAHFGLLAQAMPLPARINLG